MPHVFMTIVPLLLLLLNQARKSPQSVQVVLVYVFEALALVLASTFMGASIGMCVPNPFVLGSLIRSVNT